MVGEADLPRARARTAADHRCGGGRMVRRPKRRAIDERVVGGEHARDRMNPGRLERLVEGQRRKDAGQPARQHGLPCAGRPGEQDVVAPGGDDLERPPGALLPPHLREIRAEPVGRRRRRGRDRAGCEAAVQVRSGLGEMTQRHRFDPRQRRLGGGLAGTEQPREPAAPRRLGRDDRAGDRTEPPVQRQLTDGCVLGQRVGRNLVRGGEHGQRDREVVARALLPQPGRREVDGDPAERPLELRARDAGPDPLLRFLTCLVREPDDGEGRHASLEVGLDLDRARVETDEGMGDGARKHSFEAREERRTGGARLCTDFVSSALVEGDALDAPTGDGDGLEPDIEAGQVRAERQPRLGGLPDATGLLRPYRFDRRAVLGPGSGLHLADRDGPAAADDDVELVASRAGVRGEDPVAPETVVAADPPLRLRPEPPRPRARRARPRAPHSSGRRRSGDGSRSGPAGARWRNARE